MNNAPTPAPDAELNEKIMAVVDKNNGAFWGEFYSTLVPAYTPDQVKMALRSLVNSGILRMKEDDAEHDWEYRRTRKKINVARVTRTCDACPSQWSGWTDDNHSVYVRFRWGYLRVHVGSKDVDDAAEYPAVFEGQFSDGLDGSLEYRKLKELTKDIATWPETETPL